MKKIYQFDSYLLSKADPELIKQIFKQQQLASEDNRIFSLEVFLKRASVRQRFRKFNFIILLMMSTGAKLGIGFILILH